MKQFGIPYDSSDWLLLIDSSKQSLKTVLLHNDNYNASVLGGHSVIMKEAYANFALVLEKVGYDDHKWLICGDFKVFTNILG